MPQFKLIAPGPYGARQSERYGYSQILDLGSRVEISGQGGWHPETLDYPADVSLEHEIHRAFDNVESMLAAVNIGWTQVAHVNSYHLPETGGQISAGVTEMTRQFALRMPDHKPIWTCLGVPVLGDPGMRVEIRVTAIRN